MNLTTIDPFLVAVVLLNFFLLGTGRLKALIFAVAVQGAILGIIYPLAHQGVHASGTNVVSLRLLALAAAMIAIKAVVMPRMLTYAMREASVSWRIEPYIGLTTSLLLGAIGTGLAMALSQTLPLRSEHASHLLVPASLSTVLTSFLILTTRREALTQVVGYLVLENGIFIFGLLLVDAMPLIVEVGVLLDLFVGVFVMGIIIHHVNRQFTASTSDQLSALKE
jgi:hydrogenase-4 component E